MALQMSRKKRFIFWTIAFMVAGLIAFVGVECMLRILIGQRFLAQTDAPVVKSDIPGLGYHLAPNQIGKIATDDRGIRLRDAAAEAPVYQILLLGDSIAYGSGVRYESTFGQLIEKEMSRKLQKPVAVWNAAVPGYNTGQEAIVARNLGHKVKPDLLLVELCMNDYLEPPRLTAGGTLDAVTAEADRGGGLSPVGLLYQSRTVVFLKEKLKDLQKSRPEWFPGPLHYVHHLYRKAGWENVRKGLLDLQRTAENLNIPLLVVIFPVEEQLRLQNHTVQDELMRFMASNQIQALDLYPSFQKVWRNGLYVDYWHHAMQVDKLHLNETGHGFAASTIWDRLVADRYFKSVVARAAGLN